jgi:tetrapyrrole methylase family protein/MazG family protein
MSGLIDIMATLRGASGCPWDREQTEQTLKKFLVEEAYEVLEAIETGTSSDLQEELGDLLLQILFLSRIAEEKGEFAFSDVTRTLAEKLIRRHPHVFPSEGKTAGVLKARNAEEVTAIWGTIKDREGKYAKRNHLLDGLPLALPALERARRMWQRILRSRSNLPEETSVWKDVQKKGIALRRAGASASAAEIETVLGDLLLVLVRWATLKEVSAEEALRKASRRLENRYDRESRKGVPGRRRSPKGVLK